MSLSNCLSSPVSMKTCKHFAALLCLCLLPGALAPCEAWGGGASSILPIVRLCFVLFFSFFLSCPSSPLQLVSRFSSSSSVSLSLFSLCFFFLSVFAQYAMPSLRRLILGTTSLLQASDFVNFLETLQTQRITRPFPPPDDSRPRLSSASSPSASPSSPVLSSSSSFYSLSPSFSSRLLFSASPFSSNQESFSSSFLSRLPFQPDHNSEGLETRRSLRHLARADSQPRQAKDAADVAGLASTGKSGLEMTPLASSSFLLGVEGAACTRYAQKLREYFRVLSDYLSAIQLARTRAAAFTEHKERRGREASSHLAFAPSSSASSASSSSSRARGGGAGETPDVSSRHGQSAERREEARKTSGPPQRRERRSEGREEEEEEEEAPALGGEGEEEDTQRKGGGGERERRRRAEGEEETGGGQRRRGGGGREGERSGGLGVKKFRSLSSRRRSRVTYDDDDAWLRRAGSRGSCLREIRLKYGNNLCWRPVSQPLENCRFLLAVLPSTLLLPLSLSPSLSQAVSLSLSLANALLHKLHAPFLIQNPSSRGISMEIAPYV